MKALLLVYALSPSYAHAPIVVYDTMAACAEYGPRALELARMHAPAWRWQWLCVPVGEASEPEEPRA